MLRSSWRSRRGSVRTAQRARTPRRAWKPMPSRADCLPRRTARRSPQRRTGIRRRGRRSRAAVEMNAQFSRTPPFSAMVPAALVRDRSRRAARARVAPGSLADEHGDLAAGWCRPATTTSARSFPQLVSTSPATSNSSELSSAPTSTRRHLVRVRDPAEHEPQLVQPLEVDERALARRSALGVRDGERGEARESFGPAHLFGRRHAPGLPCGARACPWGLRRA